MLLDELQGLLDGIYDTELALSVQDFLVTDSATVQGLISAGTNPQVNETLFVQQGDDEIGLTLYLDNNLLERLQESDPITHLHDQNLEDFCVVLEGISHFNYMVWNAAKDKCVTLMELEMQAEVDKYVGAGVLLEQQNNPAFAESLLAQLFDAPAFHKTLSAEELTRYQDANDFAGHFCRSLESRFPGSVLAPHRVAALRKFYRWPQPAKVSHIQSSHFA